MDFPCVQTCPKFPGACTPCDTEIFARIERTYSGRRVFINIPYLPAYIPYAIALWATLVCCRLEPVFATDRRTSREPRLCKICELIQSCKYGISDLSLGPGLTIRPNVIFEIGIMTMLGRHVMVLLEDPHAYDERLSDCKPYEPIGYNLEQPTLIRKLQEWIETDVSDVPERPLPSGETIQMVVDLVNLLVEKLPGRGITEIVAWLQRDCREIMAQVEELGLLSGSGDGGSEVILSITKFRTYGRYVVKTRSRDNQSAIPSD